MGNDKTENSVAPHCYASFSLGMQFFLVHSDRRHANDSSVTIQKIGRKWVTLSDGNRFDRTSSEWRVVDGRGYSSPGWLWDSEQKYAENVQVKRIIEDIDRRFRFNRNSECVSLESAKQAARLLGLEIV